MSIALLTSTSSTERSIGEMVFIFYEIIYSNFNLNYIVCSSST